MLKTSKQRIAIAAMAALALAATGAAAAPGEGIRAPGDVLIRPFVNAEVSYDNNPLILPKDLETHDTFVDVNPGVTVLRDGEKLSLQGSVWGRFRRFDRLGVQDKDDWSQNLRLRIGRRNRWQVFLHERFGQVSDYDVNDSFLRSGATGGDDGHEAGSDEAPPLVAVERASRVTRDILDTGISVGGPIGDKTAVNLRYDFGKTDYENRSLLDSEEHKTAGKLLYTVTDKSDALLVIEYIQMDNDSLLEPADYYAARAGWRWKGTDKSRFEGSAGYYRFTLDQADAPESERDGLAYQVAWRWQATSKMNTLVSGRSDMQLSAESPSSSKQVNAATASVQYQATDRLALALTLGYRNEDFTETNRSADQVHTRLRCQYQAMKWLNVFGEVWHDDTNGHHQDDTQQTRATFGMKAMY